MLHFNAKVIIHLTDLLLNNKFLNTFKKPRLIPLDFKIFKNLWCAAANYEKRVTVMKCRGFVSFLS